MSEAEVKPETSPLELSDEDWAALPEPDEDAVNAEDESSETDELSSEADQDDPEQSALNDEDEDSTASTDSDTDEESVNASEEDNTDSSDDDSEEDPERGEEGDSDDFDESDTEEEDDASKDSEENDDNESDDSDSEVDYKAEYERLLAPFRAAGKDFQVRDVDEALQLMQMGVGFNKRMAALKPNLKMMRLLDGQGLLNEEKLSFLIDIHNKKPEAIAKLIQDAELDPLDVNDEKANEYKATKYQVNENEMVLDEVLDTLQDSEHYSKLLDVVAKTWDENSQQTIAATPDILNIINDHMANGVYDVINTEMERARVLGQLNGLTDLDAYRKIGDSIQARGGFDHLFSQQGHQTQPRKKEVTPKPKKPDQKRKSKRRAVSSPKQSVTAPKQDFNPLALSDEEFEKQMNSEFL